MNWNAKERSEIAMNRIWSEHVEKEIAVMKPKTKYTCNPCSSISMNNGLGSRVPFVTEKVGYSVGLQPVEIGDDPDVKAVVQGLLDAQRVPTQKYEEPITSAQEVGWFSKPLVAPNPRFVHGLKQAEATQVCHLPARKSLTVAAACTASHARAADTQQTCFALLPTCSPRLPARLA